MPGVRLWERIYRHNLSLGFTGAESWIKGGDPTGAIVLTWGPEFEISPLSGPLFQSTIAIRLGYQLNVNDGNYLKDDCDNKMDNGTYRCSAVVVQSFVALSLLQRARLHVGLEMIPPGVWDLAPRDWRYTFIAAIGFQFLPARKYNN